MALSREDVKRLADLARIRLSDEEMERAEKELDSVLGYVDRLQQVDTTGVDPFTPPVRSEWREDVALPCDDLAHELILSNFPARKGDLLQTPGVFEKPKGKN
jgi:aspartyl-tRNA(Asn)/glutamyl-tRNA(Gln) amidotransferase subunit C